MIFHQIIELKNSFPKITGNTTKATQPNQILVNNLEGVQASSQLPASAFSEEIGLRQKRFLKFNDLQESEVVQEGEYYYTEKKRSSAAVATHTVAAGETLWSISQKYGIRLASLKSKNRIPISPLSYPEVFSRFFSIRFRESGWLAFPLFPLKCSNILHYRFFSESISSNRSVFSIDYSCK